MMLKGSVRRLAIAALALLMIAGLFLVDSSAQRRRRRRRSSAPRITNPAIYQPPTTENANSNSAETVTTNENTNTSQTSAPPDPETMKQTIRALSSQVDKLTNKISQMEEAQRSLVDLERLSRAEQRATSLRAELRDVQAKESDLQARAEDLDYALKPENIERSVAGYGTTHPEELREQRRRQLEGEKERVRKQLEQLASSRAHLEQAIAAADVEVERLHRRLDAADAAAIQNVKTNAQSNEGTEQPPPPPRLSPSPSPYPTP
jgi:predicted  nucleic acid-binding Zn-ribbon protein